MARKAGGSSVLLGISVLGHVIWLVIALFLFLGGPFGSPAPQIWAILRAVLCANCSDSYDAINTAASLGRLDLIALSLTILATVLALGAFGGFFLVRSAAMTAAQTEAVAHVTKMLPALVTPELLMLSEAILKDERFLISLVNAVKSKDLPGNQVDETAANHIAAAVEEDKDVS